MAPTTSTTPHTPGPWRAEGNAVKAVDHGRWFTVARATCAKLTVDGNETNARLIAAAPDLLALVRETAQQECGCDHTARIDQHRPECLQGRALVILAAVEGR